MERKTKQNWFNEALTLLGTSGATGLTIELLTGRLNVTKGSFYYHFKNYADFKEKFLEFYEEESTAQIIRATEEAGQPAQKMEKLLEITSHTNVPVEVAFRAWALQDETVRTFQARIDCQRIGYLQKLCIEMGQPEASALVTARLLYTAYVGSQQIIPPLRGEEYKQLYGRINSTGPDF